ncbi:DsbE family thiol:disulfide interchange protein [Candidatus Thiosymbion oneisti]|uniref:DsbE family thiol:disulfide interchange protein n=1 Tax=Candidatus Thiosymbion oneisti TaxID=589554 RepID=UPI000A8E8D54|nr:DsbE family thiol:disulfide interchange protein [Candidatus Thiosymbion oneisti]
MGKFISALLPLGIFVALAALLFNGLMRDPSAIPSTMIDKPTPEFSRPSLLDPTRLVTQEALRGDITLVNVWGTWCVSCRQEHPQLLRLAGREGVKIVGFNWRDERARAIDYLRSHGNPYALTAMVGDTDPLIVNWGVVGAPETFFIDRKGTIRYKHTGPITPDIWKDRLRPIYATLKSEP